MAGVPPLKNSAYSFDVCLVSQADTDIFKTSVTLAAGDITVSKDGGAFANITTLPTEISTTGVLPVALTATEMNADRVTVRFHDASGDEWQDLLVTIETETVQLNDLATIDSNVDAILADTNELQTDWANGGRLDVILDARASQASVDTIDDLLDTEVAAILEDTGTTLPAAIAALENLSAAEVNAELVDVLRTDLIPDSYAADGAQPTIAQAILAIHQFLYERAVSGTTMTVYKTDGSTVAITLTLDDATSPTSYSRSA